VSTDFNVVCDAHRLYRHLGQRMAAASYSFGYGPGDRHASEAAARFIDEHLYCGLRVLPTDDVPDDYADDQTDEETKALYKAWGAERAGVQSGSGPLDRALLLQLVASLSLCHHMGDAADAVETALARLGLPVVDHGGDYWHNLRATLAGMGVTTLLGTTLCDGGRPA
jgi:hypothetical protein